MARESRRRAPPSTSFTPFAAEWMQHWASAAAVALAYGVVLLWAALRYHVVGDYAVETDFYAWHVPHARQILEGTIPVEDSRGPLYPMLLAAAGLFTKDLFSAAVVLSVTAASVSLFAVYRLLQRLVRADVGMVGALLMAVNTEFVRLSYSASADMVFLAVAMLATLLLFNGTERRWSAVIGASVLFGAAYMTQEIGIFALAGVPLVFLLADPYQHAWQERLRTSGVFAGAFLLAIAPWAIASLILRGGLFSDGAFSTPDVKQVMDHVVHDVGNLSGWPLGIVALIGAALSFREKPGPHVLGTYIVGFVFFSVLLWQTVGTGSSLFLLPVMIQLALRALTWPALARWQMWGRVQIGAVAAAAFLIWNFSESRAFNAQNIGSGPAEVVRVSEWYAGHQDPAPPGTVVVARMPHIAYHLGMTFEMFPTVSTTEDLFDALRRTKAAYLYFSLMETGMRPEFQFLLDPSRAPAGLRPLVSTAAPPAVLYRVELNTP